jgi:ribosomal protein L19
MNLLLKTKKKYFESTSISIKRNKAFHIMQKLKINQFIRLKYMVSKESKRKQFFIGKCVNIRKKSIATNILLKNIIHGQRVYQRFLMYSPMILEFRIHHRR